MIKSIKKRILICDDEEAFRLLLSDTLKDDYDVTETDNGREALRMATKLPFDLLIIDVKMPETHGLEVIERLRERNKTIPIIVCTAYPSMRDDFIVKTADIAGFFVKPIDIIALKQKILHLFAS